MSLSSRSLVIGAALLAIGLLAASMPNSLAQPAGGSQSEGPFKAMTRNAIEEFGRSKDEKPPGLDTNQTDQLTDGLNKLAKSGWVVIAIEPAHTRPITGPKGSTISSPPTYILQKK